MISTWTEPPTSAGAIEKRRSNFLGFGRAGWDEQDAPVRKIDKLNKQNDAGKNRDIVIKQPTNDSSVNSVSRGNFPTVCPSLRPLFRPAFRRSETVEQTS